MPENPQTAAADWQRDFLTRERLPDAYLATALEHFEALGELIASRRDAAGSTLLVAVNGSQGSGKSTLCAYLVALLQARWGLSAAALSLDDFYLTRAKRGELARTVHPLLQTRGVPGTHDAELLRKTLEALRGHGDAVGSALRVPAFDKAADDRHPPERWPVYPVPVDVVLLEGWCFGVRSVPEERLQTPLNALERDEDSQGAWRRYVNTALREQLEPLYALFDLWVMLAPPSFDTVFGWRLEQEQKLRDKTGSSGAGLMDEQGVARFVAHFERQTRDCLRQLPDLVDVLYRLDEQRRIVARRGLPS